MMIRNDSKATLACLLAVLAAALILVACGGSSSTTTTTPPPPTENTVAAVVDAGPAPGVGFSNFLYVTVTVCMPGTTTCTAVPNVQVDTGSEGLRILSSALGALAPTSGSGLPTLQDSSGDVLQECLQFADSTYIWGPVATADVEMAGEKASSVPVQVIDNPAPFDVPSSCLTLGNGGNLNTLTSLGANGIIGLGNFPQDCGGACTSQSSSLPPQYFICPSGLCSVAAVPLNDQLWNPVALFSSDNNGVLITMPAIAANGQTSATGSLTFGVGTQTDNALGSATLYALDEYGNFPQIVYNGTAYTSPNNSSFLDTGSTGIYFLDHATLGITECTDLLDLYCPASPVNYTVTASGANGTSGQVQFTIANADPLIGPTPANPGFVAFNDLGGDGGSFPSSDEIDFGMPFFYNRSVFIGIAGMSVPGNASAPNGYFAF
jgi:hypothetical protein